MALSPDDMMRELHRYVMEEMRNRGLEEAAKLIESYRASRPGFVAAEEIRRLKRDPSKQLSDWWAENRPVAEAAHQ